MASDDVGKEAFIAIGNATLCEVIDRYESEGFTGQFGARPGGLIRCFTCRADFPAGDAALDALFRLDGASDPDDMASVGALCCPRCDARGTIVLKFGPETTAEEAEVLLVLGNHRHASGGQPDSAG